VQFLTVIHLADISMEFSRRHDAMLSRVKIFAADLVAAGPVVLTSAYPGLPELIGKYGSTEYRFAICRCRALVAQERCRG
jgi:hypothetical protein